MRKYIIHKLSSLISILQCKLFGGIMMHIPYLKAAKLERSACFPSLGEVPCSSEETLLELFINLRFGIMLCVRFLFVLLVIVGPTKFDNWRWKLQGQSAMQNMIDIMTIKRETTY